MWNSWGMSSVAQPVPERGGSWQWGLREILAVILVFCVLLATSRAFHGGLGILELGLLAIASTSVLLSGIFKRTRWPWILALVLGLVALLVVAPGSWATKLALGSVVSAVYLVAGFPAIIMTATNTRVWPWMLGSITCFFAAASITAPDPLSMLMVAVPLCSCYIIVAGAWRMQRSTLLVIGPLLLGISAVTTLDIYVVAFLVDSIAAAVSAQASTAFPAAAAILAQIFAPLGLLGVATTIIGYVSRPPPKRYNTP